MIDIKKQSGVFFQPLINFCKQRLDTFTPFIGNFVIKPH